VRILSFVNLLFSGEDLRIMHANYRLQASQVIIAQVAQLMVPVCVFDSQ